MKCSESMGNMCIYNAEDMIIEYVFIAHEYSWIMFIAREQWI